MRRLLAIAMLLGACEKTPREQPPAPSAVVSASASALASGAPASSTSARPETLDEKAARVHKEAIVIDGHNDIPMVMANTGFDLAKPDGKTHTDLPRMRTGGITGEFFSIYVDRSYAEKPTSLGGGSARRALELIDLVYQQVERHPDDLLLARTAADIRRAKREGKIAALMGIEGGHAIENSLFALREFYRLGVRYMTLTHTNTNDWADSAGFLGPPVVRHHGLSPFGERVVSEMQRIGMLVDVSHVSDETFWAVIKIAKAPIIASHSSARALLDSRRNLTDDMLRAIGQNGGVAMVNFWPLFLDPAYKKAADAFFVKHGAELQGLIAKHHDDPAQLTIEIDKLKAAEPPLPKTPLAVLVDHLDHMVKVAGEDHVGLGSDFDGVDRLPEEITGIDGLPKITRALLERGYGEEQVKKILGGNFLRVFEAAEAHAQSTKSTLSGDGDTKKP